MPRPDARIHPVPQIPIPHGSNAEQPVSFEDEAAKGLTPPHSIAAAQAVLGAILLNQQALDMLDIPLGKDDFYDPRHRGMYAAIVDLQNASKPVDVVTCAAQLERPDRAERLHLQEDVGARSVVGQGQQRRVDHLARTR